MYGNTPRGGPLPSEIGDLGGQQTFPKRSPDQKEGTSSTELRGDAQDIEYDSFLDVTDETRHKGAVRSRKETLKARNSKKTKPEKGSYPGLPSSNSAEGSSMGRAGRLKKKASKIFSTKGARSDSKRPDMPTMDSASTAAGLSRMQSRSTGTSGERRDSLTTTSSEFSIASAHEAAAGPSSHLSLSPPSRRSSHSSARSSARSFFKNRRSSSQREELPTLPSRQQAPSHLPLTTNVPLSQPIPVSSSVLAARNPGGNSLRDWEHGEDSGTFTDVPGVITTSATPGPPAQRGVGAQNPSATDGQPPGIGGRMTNWFANIIPGTAGTSGVSGNAVPGRGNMFTSNPGDTRASTRPESLMSANSGPIPTSSSAPGRASFSSVPGDLTSSSVNASTASPGRKMTSTTSFLQAARQKAAGMGRWVLDSEALPEGNEPIWILGVEHRYDAGDDKLLDLDASNSEEGSWGRQYASRNSTTTSSGSPKSKHPQTKRGGSPSPSSLSTNSSNYFSSRTGMAIGNLSLTSSPSKKGKGAGTPAGEGVLGSPGRGMRSLLSISKEKDKPSPTVSPWPDEFVRDFRSIIWCTYRAQYAPILSLPTEIFLPDPKAYLKAQLPPIPNEPQEILIPSSQPGTNNGKSSWSWVSSVGAGMGLSSGGTAERGLTSDAGWGCMLRTGQCLLANSLIRRHLGRGECWRLKAVSSMQSPETAESGILARDEASYRQIISWFMDDPAAICPFSVHRMALVGKQLGKDIGEWFGPSTAAGAIKTLANAFPACGLGVSAATDGIIFRSDVFAASNTEDSQWSSVIGGLPWSDQPHPAQGGFGNKAVLILVNVRLGTNTVNPIYYDSLKALFTAPQTVGIAGGRPSSSYYFVGFQGESLFYLDPHFTRPAVPLRGPTTERTVQNQDLPGAVPIMNASIRSHKSPNLRSREDNATWLASAYTPEELSTFHCDRIRKMPMSSLDPSMLLGFLIQDHDDWQDFCARMSAVRHKIFSIQEQPPSWSDDDDDPGMESMSETDDGFSLTSDRSATHSPRAVRREQSVSIDSDLVITDDESELVVSVPPTPTRRRLRPSATETTLNARAMMDDPSLHPLSPQLPSTVDQPLFDSSAVLLSKPSLGELAAFDEEHGVMIMTDTPPPALPQPFEDGPRTPQDETVKRK